MSKRENHWYLLNNVMQLLGRGMRPGRVQVGVWFLLVAAFVIAYNAGALDWLQRSANAPMATFLLIVGLTVPLLAVGLVVGRSRRNGFVANYRKALAAPTSEPLVQVVGRPVRSRASTGGPEPRSSKPSA